jgi:hypothetical protein
MALGGLIYSVSVWRRWDRSRRKPEVAPWFAPAASTILVLTGLQLISSWLLTLVLSELTRRDTKAQKDLGKFSANGRH